MYYVYLLRSLKDKKLYLGITNNLKRRINEHNSGKSRATASRKPFEFVYCEVFKSKKDAMKREKNLKRFKKAYTELKKRIKDSLSEYK